MPKRRSFETRGPVDPSRNYFVPRQKEIGDLVDRIKNGRYIVIFAPRQTGKTTFFRQALKTLTEEDPSYLPIKLNFEIYPNVTVERFYECLQRDLREEVLLNLQQQVNEPFLQFLRNDALKDHISFESFLKELGCYLKNRKLTIIIDEFDGIPPTALSNFLHVLRRIYLSESPHRCPYSIGIVGVKSITQLNYDRSISPFNIQDEFALPNFTRDQVHDLFGQYTQDVGQALAPEVIENLYKQTAGQPFLVNRMGQILTEEMNVSGEITVDHFEKALGQLLHEPNVNIAHLVTNIRRNKRFETILMEICSYDAGVPLNLHNEEISELASYGVLKKSPEGFCEIANPIYQFCIVQTFKPLFNGLERKYLPEDTDAGFLDYLTPSGNIQMKALLDNFSDFIVRAGYRILEVPKTPQEFVGQYLLFAYLDQFIQQIGGVMYLEVNTGRGRMDLIIVHRQEKYIVETKIWQGKSLYQRGKDQLAEYLLLEKVKEGYYVVFDHRKSPIAKKEEESIKKTTIVSYLIPIKQVRPSSLKKQRSVTPIR